MFDVYKCHLLFGLLIDQIWNQKMDALTSFIVVIIAITIQFSLYAIKRLQEPLEPNYLIDKNSKKIKNFKYNSVIQLRLVLGLFWHINVTVKSLKMWNPKKK